MSQEKAEKENAKSNPLILVAALVGFALVLGGVGMHRYNVGKESVSWPTTKGVITSSRAQPTTTENNRREFRLSVSYTYSVEGKSYTGNRITASDMYEKTKSAAENRLKRYPTGGEVSVYYDSANPGTSVLESGLQKNVYMLLGAAVVCLFLAGLITVSVLRKPQQATSE